MCGRVGHTRYEEASEGDAVNVASRWTLAEEDHGKQPQPESNSRLRLGRTAHVCKTAHPERRAELANGGQADGPSFGRRRGRSVLETRHQGRLTRSNQDLEPSLSEQTCLYRAIQSGVWSTRP